MNSKSSVFIAPFLAISAMCVLFSLAISIKSVLWTNPATVYKIRALGDLWESMLVFATITTILVVSLFNPLALFKRSLWSKLLYLTPLVWLITLITYGILTSGIGVVARGEQGRHVEAGADLLTTAVDMALTPERKR